MKHAQDARLREHGAGFRFGVWGLGFGVYENMVGAGGILLRPVGCCCKRAMGLSKFKCGGVDVATITCNCWCAAVCMIG